MARKLVKRVGKQLELGQKVECTALYIRVSTDRQADEGFSLDSQKNRLAAYCEAQEWNVCTEHVYVDAGISGTSTVGRDSFNAMMNAAKLGEIKRIVAIKLDRIARNTKDFLSIAEQLQAYGCDLVLIKESFDTSTPQGKFFITMTAAMAELEAATITERVMTGKAQKATEGGYNGSACPLGYTYENGQFAIDTKQAVTVRDIFASFINGQSMASIAAGLNAGNVKTAKSGTWYTSTVKYVLTNGFYAGLAQWGETETTGNHPAIVSRKTYEDAHNRLVSIKPGKKRELSNSNEEDGISIT